MGRGGVLYKLAYELQTRLNSKIGLFSVILFSFVNVGAGFSVIAVGSKMAKKALGSLNHQTNVKLANLPMPAFPRRCLGN